MKTRLLNTPLKDVKIVETDLFQDNRGFFTETWHEKHLHEAGLNTHFVAEAQSGSKHRVLRGLHYQDITAPMEKLVRCISGEVFDVVVDIRANSPTFGKWFSIELSAENKRQIYIPAGFAHGFTVLSKFAEILYTFTEIYTPSAEGVILWNDKNLAINWPYSNPIVSEKDKRGITFEEYKKNPSFN